MPDQARYCSVHGANDVDDCAECHPEIVGADDGPKTVEEAPGHRVAASPNVPDPNVRYRSTAAVITGRSTGGNEVPEKDEKQQAKEDKAVETNSPSDEQQEAARLRTRLDAGGDKGITDDDQDQDKRDVPSKPASESGAEAAVEAAYEHEDYFKKPLDDMSLEEKAAALVACENEIRVTAPGAKRNRLIARFEELGGVSTPYTDPNSRI